MKPLRWVTSREAHAYMRERAEQNKALSKNNPNEQWAKARLDNTPHKWTAQAQWGYRIFDFWCARLGVAVEIDGREHDPEYDAYRDEYNFRRSAVVVLRVRNRNESDMQRVIQALGKISTWADRRESMGLLAHTKKERREYVNLPDSRHCLQEYLDKIGY